MRRALFLLPLLVLLAGCGGDAKTDENKSSESKKTTKQDKAKNEQAAIGSLRSIATAQALNREADKDGNGESDYVSLEALAKAELIDEVLGKGEKNGYKFECAPGTEAPEYLYWVTASPISPDHGTRHFAANHTGVVFFSKDGPVKISKVNGNPEGEYPVVGK